MNFHPEASDDVVGLAQRRQQKQELLLMSNSIVMSEDNQKLTIVSSTSMTELTVKLKHNRLMHLKLIPAAFLMLRSYLNEYHNLTMLKLSINSIPPCSPRSSLAAELFECTKNEKGWSLSCVHLESSLTHVIEKLCGSAFLCRTLV